MKVLTIYEADDGTRWDTEAEAIERDGIVRAINARGDRIQRLIDRALAPEMLDSPRRRWEREQVFTGSRLHGVTPFRAKVARRLRAEREIRDTPKSLSHFRGLKEEVRDLREEVRRITEGSLELNVNKISDIEPDEDGIIIDRGRGPELAGTRITVYLIIDFLRYNYSVPEIATELSITIQQVRAALDYIEEHRIQVESDYERILERVKRPNAPEVEAILPKSLDELRRRIMERRAGKGDHDRPIGQ